MLGARAFLVTKMHVLLNLCCLITNMLVFTRNAATHVANVVVLTMDLASQIATTVAFTRIPGFLVTHRCFVAPNRESQLAHAAVFPSALDCLLAELVGFTMNLHAWSQRSLFYMKVGLPDYKRIIL